MVLVVSHGRDAHVPRVADELDRVGARWSLLDTDDYPHGITVTDGPDGGQLGLGEQAIALREVTAVWWRRPEFPVIDGREPEIARWAERQAYAALDSALNAIDATWVNHPRCNRVAQDKPANLRRAAAAGLRVPDWLVTNDPAAAHAFALGHQAVVAKPVESAQVSRERSIWTRRIDDLTWLERLGPEPYLMQQFIAKTHDVRVTVVGETAFAVAIDSQADPRSIVDMRAGDLRGLAHRVVELPEQIQGALLGLCRSLDLHFAAVDFVCDRDGRWWFLELNPNGQWAWLEELTSVPLAEGLAGVLTR